MTLEELNAEMDACQSGIGACQRQIAECRKQIEELEYVRQKIQGYYDYLEEKNCSMRSRADGFLSGLLGCLRVNSSIKDKYCVGMQEVLSGTEYRAAVRGLEESEEAVVQKIREFCREIERLEWEISSMSAAMQQAGEAAAALAAEAEEV